jgi:SOS response regulatory protein OraA/RecX
MSAEIAIIAGSSVAGVISAAFIERLSRSTGAARAELLSLLFEKNLASEAITRVYEASQEGRIDRLERDRLLLKYKQQLDSLNQMIAHLQPVVDYADMTELRNNLVSLLENKISALDQKLLDMKSGVPTDAVDARVQKIIAEASQVQAASVEQKPFKAEEKNIDQLQKEIMQALQRLEQVEIDKD